MQSLIVLASLVSQLAGRVKISSRPSPEIRASMEKIIFWDPCSKGYQLCEFHLIWKA